MFRELTTIAAGAVALLLSSAGAAWASNAVVVAEPSSLALIAGGVAVVAWLKFRRSR